jgi:hypothetical protein
MVSSFQCMSLIIVQYRHQEQTGSNNNILKVDSGAKNLTYQIGVLFDIVLYLLVQFHFQFSEWNNR